MGFLTAGLPGASEPLPAEFLEKLDAKYSVPRSKEYVCWYEDNSELQSLELDIKRFGLDNVVVLDTETTGLTPGDDEILQLSMCDGYGNVLYSQYFRPEHHTEWPKAQAVNHITYDMVRDCPTFKEESDRIKMYLLCADMIVAYNWKFDGSMLAGEGIPVLEEVFDVMLEFAPLMSIWDEQKKSWHPAKLSACARHYGYDWAEAEMHEASADAKATAFCFRKMLEKDSDYRKFADNVHQLSL